MGLYENSDNWQNKTVVDWTTESTAALNGDTAYRLRLNWDDSANTRWTDLFAQFLAQPGTNEVTALIVGAWGAIVDNSETVEEVVAAVAGAREKLPNLTALFIGDIAQEESEISWIAQTDVSPLLNAYPKLEHFGIRGGQGLSLGIPNHDHLKSLVVESGGLAVAVIEEIYAAKLPALEYLEFYTGDENYGGDSELEDITPFLTDGPEKWPNLTYLGIRDCEYADDVAGAIAADGGAPILKQLKTLDLSLGTLGTEGVEALAACPSITNLKKIDIHHHYASDESVAKLTALGIEVDASEKEDEDDDDRYVAVSE
jgi:hypothetical protein